MNKFALALLRPINSAATSLLGFMTLIWGCWLLMPWSVFNSAHLFDVVRQIAPEPAWGIGAVCVGVAVVYGAIKPSYHSLVFGAGIAALFWLCISLCFFLSDWQNTGGLTYFFISTYASFIYLNVKVNHDQGHDWSASG